jgi:hypothetical protein
LARPDYPNLAQISLECSVKMWANVVKKIGCNSI